MRSNKIVLGGVYLDYKGTRLTVKGMTSGKNVLVFFSSGSLLSQEPLSYFAKRVKPAPNGPVSLPAKGKRAKGVV